MRTVADRNFHVPLPRVLHDALRREAEAAGRPATALARDAIEAYLRKRRRKALSDAIASYAAARAGTSDDLDPDLERAAIEELLEREDDL